MPPIFLETLRSWVLLSDFNCHDKLNSLSTASADILLRTARLLSCWRNNLIYSLVYHQNDVISLIIIFMTIFIYKLASFIGNSIYFRLFIFECFWHRIQYGCYSRFNLWSFSGTITPSTIPWKAVHNNDTQCRKHHREYCQNNRLGNHFFLTLYHHSDTFKVQNLNSRRCAPVLIFHFDWLYSKCRTTITISSCLRRLC